MASDKLYVTTLMAVVRLDGKGKPIRLKRGDLVPEGVSKKDRDRLVRIGAACTEARWNAGEKVPHHKRPPHRSSTVDPRSLRDPVPVVEAVEEPEPEEEPEAPAEEDGDTDAQEGAGGDGEGDGGMDLASLDDAALAALWSGEKPPLVKDLVDGVGDDADLARRVLATEEANVQGGARTTLAAKLTKVIEGGE